MAALPHRVSARAGIVVTGTEVLTGRVTDRNGPWLSERLREARRRPRLHAGRRRPPRGHGRRRCASWPRAGVDVSSPAAGSGRRPTTSPPRSSARSPGARWCSTRRWRSASPRSCDRSCRAGPTSTPRRSARANRKQAVVPEGATVLEPVGTAPGLVVPVDGGPTIVVLPGPPRELQRDVGRRRGHRGVPRGGRRARSSLRAGDAAAVRHPGVRDRRDAAASPSDGHGLERPGDHHLPAARRDRDRDALRARGSGAPTTRFVEIVRARHADTLFSDDGRDGRRAGRRAAALARPARSPPPSRAPAGCWRRG